MVHREEKLTQSKVSYSAPGLERALDLLELLALELNGLTVAEMTRRLDRNYSELYRLLMVLKRRGYVEQKANEEKYTLTTKLFDLLITSKSNMALIAGPTLNALTSKLGLSCYITVINDGKGVVVLDNRFPSAVNVCESLGAELSLFEAAFGKVLAAYNPELDVYVYKNSAINDSRAIVNSGYLISDNKKLQGVKDISCPIFSFGGKVEAVLTVPYISFLDGSNKYELEQSVKHVVDAAGEISNKFCTD